jgi:hypothetical protein
MEGRVNPSQDQNISSQIRLPMYDSANFVKVPDTIRDLHDNMPRQILAKVGQLNTRT